jgi:glucokinase
MPSMRSPKVPEGKFHLPHNDTSSRVLVGDVGGTHARFAVVDLSGATPAIAAQRDIDVGTADFTTTLRTYLDQAGLAHRPDAAAIAVAGPVTDGEVHFTNRDWHISENDLRGLGFADALLINDFAALAFAADTLAPSELRTIGPDIDGMPGAPITILGAGTGFGVSCLARYRGRAVPMATEGGHAGFAPGNVREIEVLKVLMKKGRAGIESVLSGPGQENLYAAIAQLNGRTPQKLAAPQIVAARDGDPDCAEAVAMFCAIYGSVAGDFALAHGARGGVYLAGGIAQKILDVLEASDFRARFEDKDKLADYVKTIPTRLIVGEDAAFIGAAKASIEFRGNA